MGSVIRSSITRFSSILALVWSAATAAMPTAWLTISRPQHDHCIYMLRSGTWEVYTLYQAPQGETPNPGQCAFSPDGRQIAFILKEDGQPGGIYKVNNDGTGLTKVCNTFALTNAAFTRTCWTEQGLFWTEITRDIYWADPATGERKVLGTLSQDRRGEQFSMSVDGTRAYLRLVDASSHGNVGGMFFEVGPHASGIVNERYFEPMHWDHGNVMLNDGSAVLWVVWNCELYGYPGPCDQYEADNVFVKHDWHGMEDSWEILVPPNPATMISGKAPFTTPASDDHLVILKNGWWVWNMATDEMLNVYPEPLEIAPGGPLSDGIIGLGWWYQIHYGQFWLGELPNPHESPAIAIDKTEIIFTNDVQPIATQSVAVSNIGTGTLAPVTAAESPDVPWLTLTVGGTGNAQTITVAPSSSGLAAGNHTTTVTVSGGGATNTRTFTVTLAVDARLLAPSSLAAVHNAGTVYLAWSDHSDNETGFQVERREQSGTFAPLARTAAEVTAYADTTTTRGVTYEYRVAAVDGSGSSEWSDTAAVSIPAQAIVVTAPVAGETWHQGQSIRITWTAPTVTTVMIQLSVDEGETWRTITATGGIAQTSPLWGDYAWTVDPAFGESQSAQVRITQYQDLTVAGYSGVFSITQSSSTADSKAGADRQHVQVYARNGLIFTARDAVPITVELTSMLGERVALLSGVRQVVLSERLPAGVYLARVTLGDGSTRRARTFGVTIPE